MRRVLTPVIGLRSNIGLRAAGLTLRFIHSLVAAQAALAFTKPFTHCSAERAALASPALRLLVPTKKIAPRATQAGPQNIH